MVYNQKAIAMGLMVEENLKNLSKLFCKVAESLKEKAEYEALASNQMHGFYLLKGTPLKVIHVFGDAEQSTFEKARVYARLIDRKEFEGMKSQYIRTMGSATDEGSGTVLQSFENFGKNGVDIPYDPKVLEEMLAENIPKLKG